MTHQSALRRTEFKVSDAFIPSHACDFLEDNGIKGRIFNSFDFGHYLTYRFYPEKRIFIDARTELYKYDFYQLYKNAIHYPDTWEQLQKRYGFDIALVKHGFSGSIRRLIRYLYNHKEWALVYYDKKSVIFLHDVPANKIAIEKFKVNFRKKKLENEDININIAMFFEKIGEYRLAEQVYIKLLEKRPKFLEAANNLSAIYIDTGRFDEALDVMFKFLKYYPKRAELYANIGTAYLRMGLEEDGLYMLERAARLNPYLRQASYMLGLVYLKRGNRDAALRQFIKYKNMDPFDPGARRILGDIYKEKGLLNKAELEYNEADRLEGR
jgi:Flp pilus assembly protein TadD